MDYRHITEEVIKSCLYAGRYIREQLHKFEKHDIEYKGRNNLVSYVDKETEKLLVKELSAILPEAAFITEEGTIRSENKKYRWIVDPLDGTTNFLHKLPVFAISIGLMEGEKVVSGVIYEINRDECFSAYLGGGAFMNGESISVSNNLTLKESLLATGFPYHNFEKLENYLSILNQLMRGTHGLRRLGSAAVDLAYVACGRIDGFFEYNLSSWDVAAGTLIVQEAGGVVTDFSGNGNFVFGKEIIAAGSIHQEMLDVIKRIWYLKAN